MHPDHREALERRVVQAAEGALAHHQYVSAIDVLTGMGLLAPTHLQAWRKGRVDFLERVIQGNLKKISLSMATFRRWESLVSTISIQGKALNFALIEAATFVLVVFVLYAFLENYSILSR